MISTMVQPSVKYWNVLLREKVIEGSRRVVMTKRKRSASMLRKCTERALEGHSHQSTATYLLLARLYRKSAAKNCVMTISMKLYTCTLV